MANEAQEAHLTEVINSFSISLPELSKRNSRVQAGKSNRYIQQENPQVSTAHKDWDPGVKIKKNYRGACNLETRRGVNEQNILIKPRSHYQRQSDKIPFIQ